MSETPRWASPSHDVTVCAASHPGLIAAHNDDTFVIADLSADEAAHRSAQPLTCPVDAGGVVLMVCDGVGGAAGAVAAWIGSEALIAALRRPGGAADDPAARLLRALGIANREIRIEAQAGGVEGKMGATCTACWIRGQHAYFAQVGDSRGYLLRGGTLFQTTWDQAAGLSAEELSRDHERMTGHTETLLHSLGVADHVEAVVAQVDVRRGDSILLCTDGLHHLLSLDAIRTTLVEEDDPCAACQRLVQAAVESGGPENVTAVIARCDGPVFAPAVPGESPAYRSRLWSRS